jgi:hypothetical protein
VAVKSDHAPALADAPDEIAQAVAADAIDSRREVDYRIAVQRMESAGATLTTTEAALFEWCELAGTPEFKQISRLVREEPPASSTS